MVKGGVVVTPLTQRQKPPTPSLVETVTEVGGTYPTGMHSCLSIESADSGFYRYFQNIFHHLLGKVENNRTLPSNLIML